MTLLMGCGAAFGAMNTMYQAVVGRTRELATLRALGFSRGSVLWAILLEAVLLCAAGGVLGCLISIPLAGWELKTMSVKSLAEVTFRLQVGPELLVKGFLLSLVLGVAGGLLPAWHGTRTSVVEALRQV
ncbi:MAG: ABC transporter permease [Candidatus Riflebacteria bacterium]|nr:ABC transporter permease [Candidatus Riflebacteria bacterium]